MTIALTHGGAGAFNAPKTNARTAAPAKSEQEAPPPPIGYRWVSKRWRVLPNGTRDYAAYHGKTAFSFLLPLSSRLPAYKK